MCGILGEFGRTVSHKKEFEKILSLSKNRGPDMVGYNSNGKSYQFGFNRLAILDITEKGNQPMISTSGRYILMCNGEIINYQNIKKKTRYA